MRKALALIPFVKRPNGTRLSRRWRAVPPIFVLCVALAGCGDAHSAAEVDALPDESRPAAQRPEDARKRREDALAAARVWAAPPTPIAAADLRRNSADADRFSHEADVHCRFTTRPVGGTTPKFYCELPGGEVVKVKYGVGNPELPSEVAASRLLTVLGFWADRMSIVRGVQCAGCPSFPFQALRCLQQTGSERACFAGGRDPSRVVYFPAAVIERRLPGEVIESTEDQGWGWYELERIDPARGGSSRAEVDALRLMAVLLAHWDNKPPNQRLVCPPGAARPGGDCASPLAIIQDLGATFGPTKIDLHNWRSGRIWKDGASCTVSMKHLPWGGGTFPDRQISEGGRQLLLGLLEQLSDRQLRDLFEGSRVTAHDQVSAEARNPEVWVKAFKDKVRQIRAGGPCPG